MPMNPRLLRPLARFQAPSPQSFLLDEYGGAVAAYSLRRLRSDYVGPAVQVRRSNDNAERTFTPEEVASGELVAWVGGNNSGFVKQWYNQAGGSSHFSQATAALQPTVVASGSLVLDGVRPAIRFNATRTDHLLTSSGINLGQSCSIFVVARLDRNHSEYSRLINGMNDYFFLVGTNAQEQVATFYGNGASTWWFTSAQTSTSWLNASRLVTTINDGSDRQWINGVSSGARSNPMASFNGTVSLGGLYNSPGAFFNQMWQGTVSELILFGGAVLGSRSGIESNILSHYGIV